jgi:hypothetical protein
MRPAALSAQPAWADSGELVVTAPDGTSWTLPLGDDSAQRSIVEWQGRHWVLLNATVLLLDPTLQFVERRWLVGGTIQAAAVGADGQLTLTLAHPSSGAVQTVLLQFEQGSLLPAPVLPNGIRLLRQAQRDAALLINNAFGTDWRQPLRTWMVDWMAETADGEARARALQPMLDEARRRDPTNPWYGMMAAELAAALGESERAAAIYAEVAGTLYPGSLDLLRHANALIPIAPDVSATLADVSLAAFVDAGFTPAMSLSLVERVQWMGIPPEDVVLSDAELLVWAERQLEFSTRTEGAAWLFESAVQAAGRTEGAPLAELERARDDSAAFRLLGGPMGGTEWTGRSLEIAAMLALAAMLGVIIRLIRVLRGAPAAPGGSRVGGAEFLGLLLVASLWLWTSSQTVRGVATVGELAGAPLEAFSGWATPEAEAWWEGRPDSPLRSHMLGMLAHRRGELERAAEWYGASGTPESETNLGVVLAQQGDVAGATALWQAHAGAVSEAEWHLAALESSGDPEGAGAGFRGISASYPTLAGPSVSTMRRATVVEVSVSPLQAPMLMWDSGDVPMPSNGPGAILAVLVIFASIFALPVLDVSQRSAGSGGGTRLLSWLQAIVPGTSRSWGPVGPLLLGAWLYLVWLLFQRWQVDPLYVSILDSIAAPAFGRYFGVESTTASVAWISTPVAAAMVAAVLLVNGVLVARAGRRVE